MRLLLEFLLSKIGCSDGLVGRGLGKVPPETWPGLYTGWLVVSLSLVVGGVAQAGCSWVDGLLYGSFRSILRRSAKPLLRAEAEGTTS